MPNLADLARDILAVEKRVAFETNNDIGVFVLTLVTSLVYDTPVDTSRALSNWRVSVGAPAITSIPALFPGEKGDTADLSADAAIEYAGFALNGRKHGEPVYVSNKVDYIVSLNNGSSGQHPGAFVEIAIARAKAALAEHRTVSRGRKR